ncbi:hypothetical protein CALK_1722 [Chitinivibrio alkaliphilus ACht1]|uniref:FMN-binding domain-containing protein n=2 Tax=Chitinivibrio TaxID=1505231 RepID=U7DAF8_9BACT|nr:hypothetical protein CALK_1722 [Chitinivibrio alkaliphilus ACht1]
MSRLFPDARDYRTVALPLSAEKRDRIEERTGEEILPGQREEYQYYEMLNRDGVVIGYTQAVTQRGEFGAIEFVFGMDTTHTINTIYIQRARERDRTFRQDEFLETFVGLGIEGIDTLEDPAGEDATIATTGVTVGVRKALVSFEELVLAD